MFSYLKKIFAPINPEPLQLDTSDLRNFSEEVVAYSKALQIHEFGVSTDGIATVRQMKNGRFRLLVNQNEVIGTYARRRDAIRGAERKGLYVSS